MIIENVLSSLLASLMAMSSVGGVVDSVKPSIPRASAQVSAETESNWSNWGSWRNSRPVIQSIDPESGEVGDTVTLTGKRFDDDNVIRFGNRKIEDLTVSENGKTLSFVIPEKIGQFEVVPDDYRIRVQDGYRFSNAVMFEVTEDDSEPNEPLSIEAIDGPAELEVGEEGTWRVDVESEGEGNLQYSVKWGDEGWSPLRLMSTADNVQSSATFTHTYNDEGTYNPEFKVMDEDGNEVTSTTTVVVGDDEEDDGVPEITNLSKTSAEVGQEITITGTEFDEDSSVMVGTTTVADGNVDVISSTSIKFTVPDLALDTYEVKVTDNDGTSNAVDLKIVDLTKVSISGVNAPVKLDVGEDGTWTVNADSNTSGNLEYSVDWGEGVMARSSLSEDTMTQSSATFTHSYSNAGTYYPKFTVTDDNGHTASVSSSVIVEDVEDSD